MITERNIYPRFEVMSVEKKRLFIGGLNSGTNEQDIRQRFNTFGSISSVEIHRRQKSDGFPEKTFAYIDIDALDSSIRKCITMLSNTKWKGGVLKIQLAKENFLTRLQKEREEVNSLKSKDAVKECKNSLLPPELTNPVPNAVPGTLIPGKKNWVVGKFGRVLPVVHMRPKGSRKICRLDPSKTVHNLKRIKGDSDEMSVLELTWSLKAEYDGVDNRVVINGNKCSDETDSVETDSDLSSEFTDGIASSNKKKNKNLKSKMENMEGSDEMEKSENKSRKTQISKKLSTKQVSNDLGLEKMKKELNNIELDDNDDNIRNDSLSQNVSSDDEMKKAKKRSKDRKKRKVSESSCCDETDLLDDKSLKEKQKHKKEKKDLMLDSQEKDFKNMESKLISDNELKETGIEPELKGKSCESEIVALDCSDETTVTTDEKKKSKKKERRKDKKLKDSVLTENGIGMMNDLKDVDVKKQIKKREQSCKEIKTDSIDEDDEKQRKKKVNKINKESTAKKLASNEKRLKAVKEREASSITKQSIIASALQNLDHNKENNSRHIKFNEEYKEQETIVEEKGDKTGRKISGSKASNWLGLDLASDDDDDDNDLGSKRDDGHMFAAKPQFEGQTGHKLFKLQKSYRGDSRFQLDERFAESDNQSESEDEAATRKHRGVDGTHFSVIEMDSTNEDDISKQLSIEKDVSMSVLQGILGKNIGTKYSDSSSKKDKFVDSSLLRYDPTRDDHTQFEQKPEKRDSLEPAVDESQKIAAEVTKSLPEISSEKYYDVKKRDLTEMFGANKTEVNARPFTFLSQDVADGTVPGTVEWQGTEELRSKPWNPVMLPYDSSGDEQDDMEHDKEQEPVQTAPEEKFFFHFGDPELKSGIFDEESLFMRTETLDQLNEHWIATRSDLTQDYKKKHKDALKRQSKMANKRARMR